MEGSGGMAYGKEWWMSSTVQGQGPGGDRGPSSHLSLVTEAKRVGGKVYHPEGLLEVQARRWGSDPSCRLQGMAWQGAQQLLCHVDALRAL